MIHINVWGFFPPETSQTSGHHQNNEAGMQSKLGPFMTSVLPICICRIYYLFNLNSEFIFGYIPLLVLVCT